MKRAQATVSGQDDWDAHWEHYGVAATRNPANEYRRRLILSMLGQPPVGSRILDIGSGQGELTLWLSNRFPQAQVRGIEYSERGVELGRRSAAATGARATFLQRDLLESEPVPPSDQEWATVAICSEVLEHLDEPERLLRNVQPYLARGCLLIVTVPGGPRTAFDRHIGHRRHFTSERLRVLLEGSGLAIQSLQRAGFPFFDLYKLVVLLRGRAMVSDSERFATDRPNRLADVLSRCFQFAFRWNLPSSPLGWQLVATAVVDAT